MINVPHSARYFRKILREGECEENHGCGVAKMCMCSFAEDVIDALQASEAKAEELADHSARLKAMMPLYVPGGQPLISFPPGKGDAR